MVLFFPYSGVILFHNFMVQFSFLRRGINVIITAHLFDLILQKREESHPQYNSLL